MRSGSGIRAGGHGTEKQKQGRRWHSIRKWKRGSRAGDVARGSDSRAGTGPVSPSSPLVVELERVLSVQGGGELPDHLQGLLPLIQAQHADMSHQPGHGTHRHAAHLPLDVVRDFLGEETERRMSTARWMRSHHLAGLWVPTAGSKSFSPPWVTLSLPAPLPPTGQFGAGMRGWSHISFPLPSHSKLRGSCQSDQGRRTGYPTASGALAPPQDTAQSHSAPPPAPPGSTQR